MRFWQVILIIALLISPAIAANGDFHKNTTRTQVNITTTNQRVTYSSYELGINFSHTILIDGSPITVNYVNENPTRMVWGTGNGIGNSDVLIQHDYHTSATDETLKGTITIQTPHTVTFPYTLQPGTTIVQNGTGIKIRKEGTKKLNDAYILIPNPIITDKKGKSVPAWYSLDSSKFALHYTDSGFEYPLTIDPTYLPVNSTTLFYMPANGTALGTGAAGTFLDLSPTGATITNKGQVVIGNANESWRFYNSSFFNGSATSWLETSNNAYNFSTNTFSVAFWYNGTSSSGTYNQLIGYNKSTTSGGGWKIGSRMAGANNLGFSQYGAATHDYACPVANNTNDGKWHYIVFTRQAGVAQIYNDGVRCLNQSISASDMFGSNTYGISIGKNVVDTNFITGYIDDVVIYNGTIDGTIIPTTEFLISAGESGTAPVASFTATPNPSVNGTEVQFNDTSANTPTSWAWLFGDGNYTSNTTQNPKHLYMALGNYTVCLNATNAYGSNTSCSIQTVTNLTSYTPQDVWMEGQYLQTFHITDSTTGLPISVVDLTLSPGGSTFTTTNGTGYLTTGFGIYTVTFVSTGYNGKTISYAFDSDESHAVQLTPANPGGNQNVWYTPWQVRIRIVDYYGKPLPSTNVTAFYVASTLPNTNTTWLTSAYGISPEVASDMVNSAVAMAGRTDDNGGLSFTMFKSLEYHLEITNTTSGVSATKNLYPSDPEYVIYVQTTGQGVGNNTLGLRNATLPWYSLNSSYISLNMSYIDGTHCTGNVTFRVWFRNNGSELHNATQSAATGTQITDSHIVLKAPIGTEYLWGYNATTVC